MNHRIQNFSCPIDSMYRLHNTSEHGSGVTNMYSISNAASRAATPMQMGGGGDQLVMLSGKYYRNTISIKERQEERSKYTFVIYNFCFPMGVASCSPGKPN